jgi:hypothetical protein
MDRAKRRVQRQGTPRFALARTMKTTDIATLEKLETIDPISLDPWGQPTLDKITIEQDSVQALEAVNALAENGERVIFTDASKGL